MVTENQDKILDLAQRIARETYKAERDDELLLWARREEKKHDYDVPNDDELLLWARGI